MTVGMATPADLAEDEGGQTQSEGAFVLGSARQQKLLKHTEPRADTHVPDTHAQTHAQQTHALQTHAQTHAQTHTLQTMVISRHTWVPACTSLLISFKSPHKVRLP